MASQIVPIHKATLLGHTAPVTAAKFHPQTPDLMATSCTSANVDLAAEDCTVKIWNLASKRCTTTLKDPCYAVNAISISRDGSMLACGSNDTFIYIYDMVKAESTKLRTDRATSCGSAKATLNASPHWPLAASQVWW